MITYKSYAAYKLTDIGWIESIPESWEVKPFFVLLFELNQKNIGLIESNILSLSYGRIIQKPDNRNMGLVPESYETYQIVEPGDVVFRFTDLQNDKKSLRSAEVSERGIISSAYMAIRPHSIQSTYFAWLMRSYDLCKVFYNLGGGIRQSLKFEDVKRLPITVPPIEDQKQISNAIDSETTNIDSLIVKKNLYLQLLTEKILALVTHSFEYQDTKWIRLRHVCDVITRPVNMQIGESYTRLGLYNRGRGAFKKVEADNEEMGDSNFFWVEEGDLILSGQFAWEGAVALATNEHSNCVVSHRFPIIHGRKDEALTEYLFAFFMTDYGDFILNDCSRGSAGRNRPLNINALLLWKVPIPSPEIQIKIASLINLREKIKRQTQQSINLLTERRTAFITALVTGKIDVRNKMESIS